MVEKQKLLNSTHSTGTLHSTAVVNAPTTDRKPPSPTRQITLRSGAASLAPMAAGGANPMVAIPPDVRNVPGRLHCNCWPAPFLFQPTSVTKMASEGAALDSSRSRRAGWIGLSLLVCDSSSSAAQDLFRLSISRVREAPFVAK